MRNTWIGIAVIVVAAVVVGVTLQNTRGTGSQSAGGDKTVVCYAALDEEFSRPILEAFEKETGIRVEMKFDTESNKSVGLANTLINEKDRPRCDVYWNNEIVNTIRLKNAGVLAEVRPPAAAAFPAEFTDPDGTWTGFAARARVLLVNTNLVPAAEFPKRLEDLLNPKWKEKIGLAKPLFGTTATHVAVLYAKRKAGESPAQLDTLLRLVHEQKARILGGNKGCAQAVSAGTLAMAFTDTDDAIIEKETGQPVELVYLDAAPDAAGTLFIPNTLSIVKGCPHPENAAKLVQYLLGPAVETALAKSSSAQIPLNPAVTVATRVATPKTVKPMPVDWDAAAAVFDERARCVEKEILDWNPGRGHRDPGPHQDLRGRCRAGPRGSRRCAG